ncbi:hypothetical protein [Zooshikella ganghwensis]|uniref:Uncharacterized protein n=1 Tax=Zooshikella ganghwensis TaxID=202772 RepID=A0A4P9VGD8_9GAMM|nr:hypothetical protein [Zooshikella ganghwensis]RDH42205.1 hypothetical protein B9G39_01395 [Zooshikella ganghwensis]
MAHYSDARRQRRDQLKGMEIFEITPIILGGSPTDPTNKTVLSRRQHIEACRYWNKKIQELRRQKT